MASLLNYVFNVTKHAINNKSRDQVCLNPKRIKCSTKWGKKSNYFTYIIYITLWGCFEIFESCVREGVKR